MLATIVFERLPCKPNLFVHNLLFFIAKICRAKICVCNQGKLHSLPTCVYPHIASGQNHL
jgi:hypothetical protein